MSRKAKATPGHNGAAPSLLRQLMEGVKRGLILGPRTRQDTPDLVSAFRVIAEQTKPHPDYDPPPLWRDTSRSLDALEEATESMPWPPERAEPDQKDAP